MMCCVGWSRWSRCHRVLFLDWAIPLTRVVMKVMLASHGGDCVRRRYIRWSELGERVTLHLCDWAHRCSDKTQSFLLQNSSQGCVRPDSWPTRDSAALPGQQALSARSTVALGDNRLGSAWLWGKRHESSGGRVPARKDHGGSFGREGQGVPFLWRRHRWRDWCCGHELGGDGQSFLSFLPHWSAASGWKLWAGLPSLGAVHFVCRPCQRWCHVVTRRGLG